MTECVCSCVVLRYLSSLFSDRNRIRHGHLLKNSYSKMAEMIQSLSKTFCFELLLQSDVEFNKTLNVVGQTKHFNSEAEHLW